MDLPLSVPAPPVGVLGLWGWRAASSEALGAVAPTCGDSGAWCSLGWSLVGFAGVVDDSELPDFVPWWAELSFETVEHYVDFFFIFFVFDEAGLLHNSRPVLHRDEGSRRSFCSTRCGHHILLQRLQLYGIEHIF